MGFPLKMLYRLFVGLKPTSDRKSNLFVYLAFHKQNVHGWIPPMTRLSIWRLRERWGTRESQHVRTCSFRRGHGRGGDALGCAP
ncbi:hypothetical protein HanXRQr2_Chr02g0057501 [Helianthus annuus]|uniref:Uncharacterized protein n=1 Tax=Helianthus annuus TaxID=4232 RepID=A0A251VEL1_HELAN|nr:hypothetical protein HanXRQr2_Chr02g0057501 [Helianthus annuus]KAJ0951181.1 hypothetical protein HanPSC8_Chr02g0056941 [Helianthus annuus]